MVPFLAFLPLTHSCAGSFEKKIHVIAEGSFGNALMASHLAAVLCLQGLPILTPADMAAAIAGTPGSMGAAPSFVGAGRPHLKA